MKQLDFGQKISTYMVLSLLHNIYGQIFAYYWFQAKYFMLWLSHSVSHSVFNFPFVLKWFVDFLKTLVFLFAKTLSFSCFSSFNFYKMNNYIQWFDYFIVLLMLIPTKQGHLLLKVTTVLFLTTTAFDKMPQLKNKD